MEATQGSFNSNGYSFGEFRKNPTGSGREGVIDVQIGVNNVAIAAFESRSGLSFNFRGNDLEKVKSSNGHVVYVAKAALGRILNGAKGQPDVHWISNESTIEKWIDKPAIKGDSHSILAIHDNTDPMTLHFGPWLNEGKPVDYLPKNRLSPQINYKSEQSGENINLGISQSLSIDDYTGMRVRNYPGTDVFLLPYNSESHLNKIKDLLREIENCCPGAKIAFIQVTDEKGNNSSELQAKALALAEEYSKGRSCPIPVVEVNPYNAGEAGQHSLLLAVNRFCEYKPQGK